ncbi:hypothetical protein [Gemmata sp.]|uniref:hypothetical protein n=1 Tax=Gemmata sp. TaxID=1914242 RepID=UPI003F70E999
MPPSAPSVTAPLRHLSIRVPWHDAGWAGTVCDDPTANTACLVLKRIGAERDDAAEQAALAGWFAGGDPGPGEDELFAQLNTFGPSDRLQVFSWRTPDECQQRLMTVLQSELKLTGPDDQLAFDKSLGGAECRGPHASGSLGPVGGPRKLNDSTRVPSRNRRSSLCAPGLRGLAPWSGTARSGSLHRGAET